MIRIIQIDGLNCPCAFCDICDKQIERDGLMVWKAGSPHAILMVHKGACDRANTALRGDFEMSRELDRAIDDLLHNVRTGEPQKRLRAKPSP